MTVSAPIEVTDGNFAIEVHERSRKTPVVVDFWAPWCGPCRVLGPVIERVAAEFEGRVALAKLNTDENPRIAAMYRIQGIPAVKAFRDGQVVDEFTGAYPEPQVRAFFDRLAGPAPVPVTSKAEDLLAQGDIAGAEAAYREALAKHPGDGAAVAGLAAILISRGERDEAAAVLEKAPADRRAKVLKHHLFLDQFAEKHAGEDLQGAAAAAPTDPRATYRWGVMLAAHGEYVLALEQLLASIRSDRTFADGAARKAALAVFDLLGLDSPVTREYQRQLSAALF